MTGESPSPPVLVYIPNQRGSRLASEVLRSSGFAVRRAETIPELELALELLFYKVIVTTTSKIGEVRDLSNLPIVNIQAFVLPNMDASTAEQPSFFDRTAFLKRVQILSDSR
ncbi:hypothetical protein HFO97_04680 [Rhizobium leguminosarum]|uniref:hypothetical protein n=1 Tax=Rhizobium leguminosarum TaxID=384 RepID=UPI001C986780|nr:hypothetical protein [Rhizobium leguminosarum]MBY5359287.1 hypothetical protein [Rhizobium leguminosarum]